MSNNRSTARCWVFENARNLFHRHVSKAWREETAGARYFLFDGEEKVLEWEYFEGPCPELKEIRTADGGVFVRREKREPWLCTAGPHEGLTFDRIERYWDVVFDSDVEEYPQLALLVQTGDVNLVGLDAAIREFSV